MNNQSKILRLEEENYPALLREIYDPPKMLYYEGDIAHMDKLCLAIVGTRRFSEYGQYLTEKIIEELSIYDITIVSGLAKGIDALAHKNALRWGLSTVAVLGSGLNAIYPKENCSLAKEIAEKGLLLSEYAPDTLPIKFHFPQRNLIISGLSAATLVIEAPDKSGALLTAYNALDQNREVFTIPADIDRASCAGNTKLLGKGHAHSVSSGKEIIEALAVQPLPLNGGELKPSDTLPPTNFSPDQKKILAALTKYRSRPFEEIQLKTSLPTPTLLTALSLLEIQSAIQIRDGKYRLKC